MELKELSLQFNSIGQLRKLETFNTMATVITGKDIEGYRARVLLSALKLEILGIKRSRGRTAYSIIKREFNLKGSRQSVYDQFKLLLG